MKRAARRTYVYCSLNAFFTGVTISDAAKMPLNEFARRYLFAPLEIDRFDWLKAAGVKPGGRVIYPSVRDLAAVGQMYLEQGVFHGKHVLNPKWIAQSWAKQVLISPSDPYADSYGFMWYFRNEPTGRNLRPFTSLPGTGQQESRHSIP